MDEPLSNLDAKLRVQMRAELMRLHERLGTTTVYVTHDQVEAMTLGHRVTVLRDGVLQQVDTPQNLYRHPANLFVAAFIGSPPMNLVEAEVRDDHVRFAGWELPIDDRRRSATWRGSLACILGIRPADIEDRDVVARRRAPDDRGRRRRHRGARLGGQRAVPRRRAARRDRGDPRGDRRAGRGGPPAPGGRGARCVFCARVDARTKAAPGARIRLSLDPSRFHYFDPDTGLAIEAGAA